MTEPTGTGLRELVDRWIECTEKIKEFNAEKKDWADAKKELTDLIIQQMQTQQLDKFTGSGGTVEMKKKLSKKSSVSKKKLKEIIEDAEDDDIPYPLEGTTVCEFIFNQFPSEERFVLDMAKSDIP